MTPAVDTQELTQREHIAVQAVAAGEADEYQQKLFVKVIVDKFSRSHDLAYVPDSPDQTTFLAGRGFVGKKILKYINKPVSKK